MTNKTNNWFEDIEVELTAEIGRSKESIKNIVSWRRGTTIKLEDSKINSLPVYANNQKIGHGSVLKKGGGEMDLMIEKVNKNKRSAKSLKGDNNE